MGVEKGLPERKVILYIGQSLDGYIATEDENLDWLLNIPGEGDNGFGGFYETVDTIIMGRKTYDWIIQHEQGRFPYEGKECFVYSHQKNEMNKDVTFTSENPRVLIDQCKQKEGKNIWIVGGGNLIENFVKDNLIDEIVLNVAPVLLGSGIPLFTKGDWSQQLELTKVQRYNQFVELHYSMAAHHYGLL